MRYKSQAQIFEVRQLQTFEGIAAEVICRRRTSDSFTVGEANSAYRKLPLYEQVVLDLGANIGTFALQATISGARKVICVEADFDNFQMLKLNTQYPRPSLELRFGAVVSATKDGMIRFYRSHKVNRHSLDGRKGQISSLVPRLIFKDLLQYYRPTVCKIDIEGGEYDLLEDMSTLTHSSVSAFAAEFHLHLPKYRAFAKDLPKKIDRAGWRPVLKPLSVADPNRSYCLQGVWVRE